jgi:hypothetical protein
MLNPELAGKIWQQHFDTVTDEEFIANIKRFDPDFAQELWGGRSVEQICREGRRPVHRPRRMFASLGRSVLKLFS